VSLVSALVPHLLLTGSIAALGGAGLRLTSLVAPCGLERVVSWAVFVAAGAVLQALALGVVGLAGSAPALSGAAMLTWLAARRWLPSPTVSVAGELAACWRRLTLVGRVSVGALGGTALSLCAILLHRPAPGFDGITYHLPEIVGFVQSGHAGAVLDLYYELPVGNYPLTNEVLLAWMTGISHGFAALTLFSPASALLLITAGWLGLRSLGVAALVRGLALGALMLGPLLVSALPQPGTDLPALSWLACSAGLCVAAVSRPVLVVPAVVALGLAVGTKTTAAVLGILVIAAALWACRGGLRAIAWKLGVGAGVAAVAGATWYVRNLIEHGSPLWPFIATPWGDPVPEGIRLLSHTMAQRLRVTLLDHLGGYVSGTSGSLVLLVGALLVPVLAFRRRALLAAGAVALGTVAWANAPATGLPDVPFLAPVVGTTLRYLLPVFAAGAVALALVATDGTRLGRIAGLALLTGALAWALISDLQHGFFLPFSSWLTGGMIAGALMGALCGSRSGPAWLAQAVSRHAAAPSFERAIGAGGVLLMIAAGGVLLTAGSGGFVARHALVVYDWDASVARFLSSRPSFHAGRLPIATAPGALGLLAGDRLHHPLALISEHEPCARVRARTRDGWVVVRVRVVDPQPVPGHPGLLFPPEWSAQGCLARRVPLFDDGTYRVYGPPS